MHLKVAYIFDKNLQCECDRLPAVLNRASMVHDLINSYNLLSHDSINVISSQPATEDELKYFHSSSYLEFIKNLKDVECLQESEEEEITTFGLAYDCSLISNLYNVVKIVAGSSLTAAKLLCTKEYDVAINWFGGWHHAQRDEAEGFCYVNDVVLAIQKLTESFKRILYIDLDIHHGNGVQNAFELSRKILTLSFHKFSPGFYPCTGDLNDVGSHSGKYYSLNVPLLEGCSDKTYLKCFTAILARVMDVFQPHTIVVQNGADCINGDPIGQCNLTPKGMGICIQQILNYKLPTLILGGGGYNFPNAARHWTYLTSIIIDKTLDNDIPITSEYFTKYGPSFELEINAGNQKDYNTDEHVNHIIATILDYCTNITID